MSIVNEQDVRRISYNQILDNTNVRVTGTTTWDPGNLIAAAQETKDITVTGAALGDSVIVSFSLALQGMQLTGSVESANVVTAVLKNSTLGAINLASGTLKAHVWKV